MTKKFILVLCVLSTTLCATESISDQLQAKLVKAGAQARKSAYAPYSKFNVGAAVLTDDGRIYTGCNVENASYPLTCCAERVAVYKAVSEGARNIIAVAVIVPGGGTPCGGCRQVLNEFNPDMLVLYGDEAGNLTSSSKLTTLLPDAFGPHNLK